MSKRKGDYPRDCYLAKRQPRRQPDPVQDAIVIDAIMNGRSVTFPNRAEADRLFHKAKGLLDDRHRAAFHATAGTEGDDDE